MAAEKSFIDIVRCSSSTFTPRDERRLLTSPSDDTGYPLYLDDSSIVGLLGPPAIPYVREAPHVFAPIHDPSTNALVGFRIHPSLSTPEERTHAIEAVLLHWKSLSVPAFRGLNGWRHERFGVYDNSGSLAFAVERSGASLLGSRCYGCHLNGYIRDPASGQIKMWIARRSLKKPTHPGALDNIVGGGLPTGSSPLANIIKECAEEAGIPDHLASKVTPCGTISYITNNWSDPAKSRNGFYQDTEYVYDLELSPDFVPQPEDGEVEQFYLWDLDTVKQHILNGEFVLESAFVVIDFLIRHGYLHAGNDPHFLEIVTGIHRTLISPGPALCL